MESVKETIRKLYATLETQLDAGEMIGKLQSAGLIGIYQKEEVQGRPNKIDKNRAILDHIQLFDEEHLRSFCDVLSTCSPPLGAKLAQKISDGLDDELGLSFRTKVYSVPVPAPTSSEAARTQEISVPSKLVDVEHLVDYVPRMSGKWEFIAVKLGLKHLKDDLLSTKGERGADSKCLHVLQEWIASGNNVTWSHLLQVLRSPSVNLGSLANELEISRFS
jgi:hypothetical protein